LRSMVLVQYVCTVVFLVIFGILAAKIGGSSVIKSVLRITIWGTVAMGATALIGYLFSVQGI